MSKAIKDLIKEARDNDVSIEITITINGFREGLSNVELFENDRPFQTHNVDHINNITIKTTDRSSEKGNYIDSWLFLKENSELVEQDFENTIAEYVKEDIKRLENNRND